MLKLDSKKRLIHKTARMKTIVTTGPF